MINTDRPGTVTNPASADPGAAAKCDEPNRQAAKEAANTRKLSTSVRQVDQGFVVSVGRAGAG
jgi:hypothetical protein